MTVIELLDKHLDRITARGVAGAGIFALTLIDLLILVQYPELADNDLFKTLSQAIVVQGLVGLAMASWFTARNKQTPEDSQ